MAATDRTVTKMIFIPVLDENGEPKKLPSGEIQVEREIGAFTFRKPTMWDEMEIGTRRSINLKGQTRDQVDPDTYWLADAFSRLSTLIEKAPDKFDLLAVDDVRVIGALYRGLNEALGRGLEDAKEG